MIIALLITIYILGVIIGLVMNKCYERSPKYNTALDWCQSLCPVPQVIWPLTLLIVFVCYVFSRVWIGADLAIEWIADQVCPNTRKED